MKGLKKDLEIALYFFKLSSKISKTYVPILFFSAIFKAAAPFLNVIMPKFIIDELLGQQRIPRFIILVSIVVLGNAIINIISRWLDTKVDIKNSEILNGIDLHLGEKIMNMDFEKIEDPEILNMKENALYPIDNQGALWQMIEKAVNIVVKIITALGLVAVIATLNIFIVLVILAIVLLNAFIFNKSQKVQYKFYGSLIPINRAFQYYSDTTTDFSMGKDIRLYDISPLMMEKIEGYNKSSVKAFGGLFKTMGKYEGLNQVNVQVQMAVVYAYMTYRVFIGNIGIGSFTMYINAANNFSTAVSDFIKNFMQFRQMCRYLELYVEFDKIKSSKIKDGKNTQGIKDFNLEFKNVSFKYPRSKEYTLKNVSITINQGEKLSVVGLNGAGKTTFIKVLTRLYEPTEGEILLNGINIKEYNYEEYMKLLSVVFQDFKLMAFSVKENIIFDKNDVTDEEVLENLKKAGLEKDIEKLPKGIETSLYKTFDKEGIEFSGGQAQKLAIARAIFKAAPIVVLDEPTAALDPLAEYEIYSKFNDLIGDKTTIYISHRLSSCKFCDKIAVFSKGEIVQYGSHEDLIKEKNSQYEEMYMAQAQYYI